MGEILGVVGIPAIAIICYLIGDGLKAWDKFDDRKIPVIMGIAGAVIGILAFIFTPGILPAEDIISAIAIGIVSGFTATGVDQLFKQLKKEG